jgi:hypothetical protein
VPKATSFGRRELGPVLNKNIARRKVLNLRRFSDLAGRAHFSFLPPSANTNSPTLSVSQFLIGLRRLWFEPIFFINRSLASGNNIPFSHSSSSSFFHPEK